jgi:hypothetical protein
VTIHLGDVPASSTLYIPITTYDANGASVTLTGLATTDIEIYKNGSVTQRSSDAGYALLDTDGIDFDGITGLHGFSIDLSDNTDAGFYVAGSFYWVVVSTVTVSTQTVTVVAATFRIREAETTAGRVEARVASMANGSVTAAAIATDAIDADAMADGAITAATFAAGAIDATAIANGAIDAATFAAGAVDAAALAADAGTEIGTAVWATAARTLTALDEDATTLDLDATIRSAVGLAAADLDTQLGALPTAAEINAEVVDALNVDTYAEPGQGAPAATTSLVAKIGYLYKAWRNKKEQTATLHTLYNDDGTTAGQKSTVSDDATTATRGEMVTGA